MHYKASTRSTINKIIKTKQGTKYMLCENKLTNLVFKKTKKIVQNTILVPFSPFFFNLKKQKQPRMKCMNVMQCKS